MSGIGRTAFKKLTAESTRPLSYCFEIGYKIPRAVSIFPTSQVCNKLTKVVDAEAEDFKRIRLACLPELILAYITVLDYGSRWLSRDLLLKGMELAALVAAEDSDLGACFMDAGRMSEFVESLASLSMTMIQAEDRGAKNVKGKKKKKNGETLSLWTIRAPSP